MKIRKYLPFMLLLAIALAGAAGYRWYAEQVDDSVPEYVTAAVTRGDIEDTVSALGALQPREFVDVGTQVSGQLRNLAVAIGDTVERGALVAEIDPAVFAAKVEAGKATLASLESQIAEKAAQHTLASRQYERNVAMFSEQAASQDTLDVSLAARQASAAQIEVLRAQQQQTRANLKVDEANLGYTRIYAPMSGTVVSLSARQGQTLNANQQAPIILRVADLNTMTVVAQVSEADVAEIKPGMRAYFNTLGRPQRRWNGKVRQILPTPETINNVVLYHVLFDVENTDRELKTQMSAQVFFVTGQAKNALVVPMAALKQRKALEADKLVVASAMADDGAPLAVPDQDARKPSYFVRVLKDGQAERRKVSVGIMNRVSAQILSGLAVGEMVVLDGVPSGKRSKTGASKRTGRS